MGIKGFNIFINKTCPECITINPIQKYSGKTVGIDVSILLYKFRYMSSINNTFINSHITGFISRILYYRKNNISLDKIIEDTINGFIKFITNECKQKHFNLFFIGVHAPVLNKNISKEDSELQINVINKWNKSLSIILENTEYKFINTYNITANKDGYSNLKYMCDETHLKPDFIENISQTIV